MATDPEWRCFMEKWPSVANIPSCKQDGVQPTSGRGYDARMISSSRIRLILLGALAALDGGERAGRLSPQE